MKKLNAWMTIVCLLILSFTTNANAQDTFNLGDREGFSYKIFHDIQLGAAKLNARTMLTSSDVDSWSWQNTQDISRGIVPGKYVIDFEDDADEEEINEALAKFNLSSVDGPYWEEMKMEIVSTTNQAALRYLAAHDDVEGVEPVIMVHAYGLKPNDPLYDKQWHMKRVGVESAWKLSVGRGVTVAVIDTGVACDSYKHFHKLSDLTIECVPGYNFIANNKHANDDHGHGSHVAGTIAQATNNKLGGVGIAWGVKIMPVKVLSGSGSGSMDGVAAGIRWAADHGAQVMNLSLGSHHKSAVIQRAVNHARRKGVVVVAAAGNSGGSVGYPGACDGVIAVSATGPDDKLANFSSRGPEVDIGAPGVDVTQQTICDGGRNNCEVFGTFNGTSMASPHVAGVVALLIGQGITDPDTIESYLTSSAKNLGNSKREREYYGAGLLQGDNAVFKAHWTQVGWRGFFLLLLSFLTFKYAESRGHSFSIKSPEFWVAGTLTAVGAFILPIFMSRHALIVDYLSRPIGDWSILLDVNLHQYLPFANALVPLAIAAVFLKFHHGAGKWIGGVFVGTAAYLVSNIFTGHVIMPFGSMITTVWCAANAALCCYVGSLVLMLPTEKKV